MIAPLPTIRLGFVQIFITQELLGFLMEEINNYANYSRQEMNQKSSYPWSGCCITDITLPWLEGEDG